MATMNVQRMAAFACYAIFALISAVSALAYLLRPEFMPYHAAMLGRSWSELAASEQGLVLGLMRAVGGAWLSVAVAVAILLWWPFRQGARWSFWAIPLLAMPSLLVNLYVAIRMSMTTPAAPPWEVVALNGALLIAGLLLSLAGGAKTEA